jgi:hypothetical protein
MTSKHRTKIRRADSGTKPVASENSLWNTQRIVAEKYKAWLIRRGFREEAS